jgi:hypothetical protein
MKGKLQLTFELHIAQVVLYGYNKYICFRIATVYTFDTHGLTVVIYD